MKKQITKVAVIMMAFFAFSNFYGQNDFIANGKAWHDTQGNIIQAHGASIIEYDGLYYMIGEDRSRGHGFQGVNLYSSKDLMNWTFRNKIIDKNTNKKLKEGKRFIERPNIIYNKKTKKFVVWVKYPNQHYNSGEVAVFTSKTIDGDYKFIDAFQPLGNDANDSTFFKDDDGTAYYIANNKGHRSLNLYRLTDDYMKPASVTVLFPGKSKEAPVLFKKDGLYYILTSHKTGWRPNQGQYATSKSLTRGWSDWKNFGDKITYDTQPTTEVTVNGTDGTSYFYVGDRWKDPSLPESKIIVYPMEVKDGKVSLDPIKKLRIDVAAGTWESLDNSK